MTFGEKLKEARKRDERSQKWCASLLGVAISTYQRYESNLSEPTIKQIEELCAVLHASPIDICGLEDVNEWYFYASTFPNMTLSKIRSLPDEERDRYVVEVSTVPDVSSDLLDVYYRRLHDAFIRLNLLGKQTALERIEELTLISKYTE